MSTESQSQSQSQTRPRRLGRVKWFGRRGYGFIVDVNDAEKEYFVHHSGLVVSESQDGEERRVYKKLTKGEYIECSVIVDSENRDCAVDVTGIQRGPLMCESNPSRPSRFQRDRIYDDRRDSRDRDRRDSRDRDRRDSRDRDRRDSRDSRNRRNRRGRRDRRSRSRSRD
jgi:cold shock CspA family protein